jgi:hypothetical protein
MAVKAPLKRHYKPSLPMLPTNFMQRAGSNVSDGLFSTITYLHSALTAKTKILDSSRWHRQIVIYRRRVKPVTMPVQVIGSDAEFPPALQAAEDRLVVVDFFATWLATIGQPSSTAR